MTSSQINADPLLEAWTGPFEAPPFDRFEPGHYEEALQAIAASEGDNFKSRALGLALPGGKAAQGRVRTAVALDQVRRSASESLRRWLRGAVRHQFLDEFLQFSAPSPGDKQPDADGGVARRHGQNRGGGEGCGYAASLGQRKRVAHIPTAEAARSGLILEGQRQVRLHLKFNDPWSLEWGPVHLACAKRKARAVQRAAARASS